MISKRILYIITASVAFVAVFLAITKYATVPQQVGKFIPTSEWQEVLPGQSVPKGLKIKMDFNTHKKFAKLDDGIEDDSNRGVLVSGEKSPEIKHEDSEIDKFARIVRDTILNKDTAHPGETSQEMKERVLLGLPEPIEELKTYHTLSEEEKKRIIDKVWEKRQNELTEVMKNVRGDILYHILEERVQDLQAVLKLLEAQKDDEPTQESLESLEQTLRDLNWLILDVDNAEDFGALKGEELLTRSLEELSNRTPVAAESLMKEAVVLIGSFYKNVLTPVNRTNCIYLLQLELAMYPAASSTLRQKLLYSMNILIMKDRAIAESFINLNGIAILEKNMLESDYGLKQKSLLVYHTLLATYATSLHLSSYNICSFVMQDVLAVRITNYPLIQSYMEILQDSKQHNDIQCIEELKQSSKFMQVMREMYRELVDLARKEVIEDDEGYYTSLVHLIHGIWGKEIE